MSTTTNHKTKKLFPLKNREPRTRSEKANCKQITSRTLPKYLPLLQYALELGVDICATSMRQMTRLSDEECREKRLALEEFARRTKREDLPSYCQITSRSVCNCSSVQQR